MATSPCNSLRAAWTLNRSSLTKLDEGDNLVHITDFRRVYATMISGWLGHRDTSQLLNGDFKTFEIFA